MEAPGTAPVKHVNTLNDFKQVPLTPGIGDVRESKHSDTQRGPLKGLMGMLHEEVAVQSLHTPWTETDHTDELTLSPWGGTNDYTNDSVLEMSSRLVENVERQLPLEPSHDIPDDPSDDIKRKPTLAISPKPSVKKSKSKLYNFQYSHHKISRDINKRLGLSQNTPAFGPYAYIAEPRLYNCEKYTYSIYICDLYRPPKRHVYLQR